MAEPEPPSLAGDDDPGDDADDDRLALARDIADSYRGSGSPAPPRRRRRASPRRAGRDDPVRIADALGDLVRQRGWDEQLTVQRVFTDWAGLVGADIAAHCTVEGFADAVVDVRADSTAWARELKRLAPGLVRRLNDELGHGTVLRVEIRGPHAPSWKKGRRSVRDGRGPRDTYG